MTAPTVSDEAIWQSIKHQTMDELAQEIGRLCMYWSELEMVIATLLAKLLTIEETVPKNIVIGALDFRGKLFALLPIAFHRKPSEAWYESLEDTVNLIDNQLRPERNRIIHDYWIEFPGEDDPHRMQIRAKVVKVQARTRQLELASYKPFTAKDVGLLYVQIIRAKERIEELAQHYSLRSQPSPPTLSQNPNRD